MYKIKKLWIKWPTKNKKKLWKNLYLFLNEIRLIAFTNLDFNFTFTLTFINVKFTFTFYNFKIPCHPFLSFWCIKLYLWINANGIEIIEWRFNLLVFVLRWNLRTEMFWDIWLCLEPESNHSRSLGHKFQSDCPKMIWFHEFLYIKLLQPRHLNWVKMGGGCSIKTR